MYSIVHIYIYIYSDDHTDRIWTNLFFLIRLIREKKLTREHGNSNCMQIEYIMYKRCINIQKTYSL